MSVRRTLPHYPRTTGLWISGIRIKHPWLLIQHHDVWRCHHPHIVSRRGHGERVGVTAASVTAQHIADARPVNPGIALAYPGLNPFLPLLVEAHRSVF